MVLELVQSILLALKLKLVLVLELELVLVLVHSLLLVPVRRGSELF